MIKLLIMLLSMLANEVIASELSNVIDYSFTKTEHVNIQSINDTILDKKIKIDFRKHKVSDEYENNLGRIMPSTQDILVEISINGRKKEPLIDYKSIPTQGQKIIDAFCMNEKKNIILILMLLYGDHTQADGWFVQFVPNIFEVDTNGLVNKNDEFGHYFNNGKQPYFDNRIVDEPELTHIYPYYTRSKILDRAYEVGLCEKVVSESMMNSQKNTNGGSYL